MIRDILALFVFLVLGFFYYMEGRVLTTYDITWGQECVAAYQADLEYHRWEYKENKERYVEAASASIKDWDDVKEADINSRVRTSMLNSRVHNPWREGLGPEGWWECLNTAFTGVTNRGNDSMVDPWPVGRVQ